MPEYTPPNYIDTVDLTSPEAKLWLPGDPLPQAYALSLMRETFQRLQMWRLSNCDPRWRLNEWLYYGYVPPKTWEGSNVPRSNVSINVSFDQVEAAHAKLSNELLSSDEVLTVFPEGDTNPAEAVMLRDRILYILDHNMDDEGWTARMELSDMLKDVLIYGNCFGMIEYDHERRQAVVFRVDPRDAYIDNGATSSYLGKARTKIIVKAMTLSEVEAMRGVEGFTIPPKAQLNWLQMTRTMNPADSTKSAQESARGFRYLPVGDDRLPLPSSNLINVFIGEVEGREIWTLNNEVVIYNEPYPYGCSRLVSAPCFTVPNRFYAQSLVDVLDPIQQIQTSLINWHMDELALAMRPPRAAKRGITRTPSSMSWRPGLVNEYDNPKDDQVVYQPQGITSGVWQTLGYFDDQAGRRSGQNSMAVSGTPQPSNANRTRGGMQMQMQGSTERMSKIAANFESFCLGPLFYKLLKVENLANQGYQGDKKLYGKRPTGTRRTPAGAAITANSFTS